jgi:hypothetical protein
VRAVIVCLALVQLAISFVYILAGEATINAFLTNDDTYYYLQTAWNARHLGFVTFDGINPTNGVQFLWFTILYGLAFLASDKSMFLAVASAAAIVLTCVPYLVIWRLPRQGSNSRQTYVSVFMALVWFLVCAYRPNRYLTGLESPLHAAMIWMIVLQYVRIRRLLALGALASSSVLFFVVLLVLNTWARLDSFGLSASFLILLLLTIDGPLHPTHPTTSLRRSLPVGTYVAGVAVIVAGAAALFGFFQLSGGSLMPVSALVKGYQVDRFSLGAFYNWSLVLFPLRIQGANLLNILGIVAMCASFWKLVRMQVDAGDTDVRAMRLVAIALGVSVFIHSLVTFGMFRYYYFWYLSASFTYWTIVFSSFLVEFVERRAWGLRRTAAVGLAVAVVLVSSWRLTEPAENLAAMRYRAAKWIAANVGNETIVGSFNAGQLGFFSNRAVVNLDGLINNVSYFEDVLRDPSPDALSAYMRRVGIDCVADYALGRWRESIEREFTTIQQFELAGGGTLRVMTRSSRASRPERAPSGAVATSHTVGR